MWTVFLIIGIVFGIVAGLMAYVIAYNEYSKHYPEKNTPRRLAMQSGLFTFSFFFGISLLIGLLILIFQS